MYAISLLKNSFNSSREKREAAGIIHGLRAM